MSIPQESRACATRDSARPQRLRYVVVTPVVVDAVLAVLVVVLGLAIIADPPAGPLDGRHLLAVAAVSTLIIRTTTAAPRR